MTKELGMYLHSVYILSLTRKVSTGTKAGQKRLPLLLMFTLSASWDSLLCLFLQASQEIASWRTEGARLQKMYLRCKLWVLFQRWMSPKVWASLNLGSLIQHFIRQRGQIQVWTHLGHVSGLFQFGFLFCPLQWSRKLLIPSATHPDQWVLFLPVVQLKKKWSMAFCEAPARLYLLSSESEQLDRRGSHCYLPTLLIYGMPAGSK